MGATAENHSGLHPPSLIPHEPPMQMGATTENINMSDSETSGDAKRGRARAKKAAEPRGDNSEEPKAKRGRGRPKGTAKKAKKAAASKSPGGGKRGRGRPPKKVSASKESKNSSDQGGSDASEGDD